jgi:hypothetical protein
MSNRALLPSKLYYVLKMYQQESKRTDLNLTIQGLQNMAVLTENLLSTVSYVSVDDARFAENLQALQFFTDWYNHTKGDPKYV